ncbi:hypothetical protein ACWGJW_02495 [Streptomyces nigrescens]
MKNVVSVNGGKVHTMSSDVEHGPFPLCRSGAQSSTGTEYRETDAEITCKTCVTYAERRAAKKAEAMPLTDFGPNTINVKGGDVHATKPGTEGRRPNPLCTGGVEPYQSYMFRHTKRDITCKPCLVINKGEAQTATSTLEDAFDTQPPHGEETGHRGFEALGSALQAHDEGAGAMTYTVKYNRTTNHIDGLNVRTASTGEERGGVVAAYSQNACGSLTRYSFANGSTHENLADALAAARAGGRKLCKTCESSAEAQLAAEAEAASETPHGEEVGREADASAKIAVWLGDDATSQVSTNLYKSDPGNSMTELWERCSLESEKRFREDATRLLGDLTEVSGDALKSADWHELFTWFSSNDETESDEMATKGKKTAAAPKAANVDVDALISDVHATIDQMKAVDPAEEGAATRVNDLAHEAEEKIRQLPTNKRTALRGQVRDARKVADPKKPEAEAVSGTIVRVADDFNEVEGVPELIQLGTDKVREGVALGLRLSTAGEAVANINLDIRTRIINPDTGLPDLMADRKTTKNAASEVYRKAKADIAEDDVVTLGAHNSLVKAAQNKISDVLVEWLRALDNPDSADAFKELFPSAAEIVDSNREAKADGNTDVEDWELSPMEVVYKLYEEKGVTLPRKGRTELERERKAAAALEKTRKALEVAKERKETDLDAMDEDEVTELNGEIAALEAKATELEAKVPAEARKPVVEKTAQEKAFAKVEKAEALFTAVTKGADKLSDDEKADLKAKLNELVSKIAAEAAKL